jgi:hypothetical protein
VKVPEGVRERYFARLDADRCKPTRSGLIVTHDAALKAALEQLREELEGDEATEAAEAAHDAVYDQGDGIASTDELVFASRRAALNSVLGDKEKGS